MAKWAPCDNCGLMQDMHTAVCEQCKEVYVPVLPRRPPPWKAIGLGVASLLLLLGVWYMLFYREPRVQTCIRRCMIGARLPEYDKFFQELCTESCNKNYESHGKLHMP